ncbi:MAG: hypothetical protein V1918_01605 [Planctomycetota bacterium]
MPMVVFQWARGPSALAFFLFLAVFPPWHRVLASEEAALSFSEQRARFARAFTIYDFEPRGDLPDSRDRDHDNLPDYWRKLRGELYPDYEKMLLVEDPTRHGFYPDRPGHVLYLTYSGEEVGAETVIPKSVDPELAYEVSAFARTRGLEKSIVSLDIVWLHIENDLQGREEMLGDPERIVVPPGQSDWNEAPLRRRVDDLPPRANAVRLVCRIRDDPVHPGADRHGEAWFDDITILPRPKIEVAGLVNDATEDLRLQIAYKGLKKKPDPEDPRQYLHEAYRSRVVVHDIHGQRIYPARSEEAQPIQPGPSESVTQEIVLSGASSPEGGQAGETAPRLEPLGIYYVQVTLYGDGGEPLAASIKAVSRCLPPRERPEARNDPRAADQLGVWLDPLASQRRAKDSALLEAVRRLGLFRGKIELWPEEAGDAEEEKMEERAKALVLVLHEEGFRFTGVFGRLPAALIPAEGMQPAMRDRAALLRGAIRNPAVAFGSNVDDWQWGSDRDETFGRAVRAETVNPARAALHEITTAFQQALPVVLGEAEAVPPYELADAVSIDVPAALDEHAMLAALARLTPSYFRELVRKPAEVFPSEELAILAKGAAERLAAAGDGGGVRREEGLQETRPFWLTIEPLPVDPYLRQPNQERRQAIDLVRKAVLGLALGVERIFFGSLTDPEQGLAEVTREGDLVPRPAFLAVRTLADYLGGAQYLGSFQLGADMENYIFRTPRETALAVLWYNGPEAETTVDLGIGFGRLMRIDLAGNKTPLAGGTVRLGEMPILLEGMPVPLARTRMSIRILDDPPLRAHSSSQRQALYIRNFFSEPLVGSMRLLYAAHDDHGRLRLEPGWTNPSVLQVHLPPGGEDPAHRVEGQWFFDVRPTPETALGRKFVRLESQLSATGEAQFNLLRTTYLTSDVAMEVSALSSPYAERKVLRLSLLWQPDTRAAHPPRLEMRPYYQFAGDAPIYRQTMVLYPAGSGQGQALRDLYLPGVQGRRRVFIGADEEGGGRFVRQEVTDFVFPPVGP